jgi:hypothetical protein
MVREAQNDTLCCLPLRIAASASWMFGFRGSRPRLHLPMTLRGGPYDPHDWSRHDWLHLACMTISFPAFLPVIWRLNAAEAPPLVFGDRL